jgi:hypothetical protein
MKIQITGLPPRKMDFSGGDLFVFFSSLTNSFSTKMNFLSFLQRISVSFKSALGVKLEKSPEMLEFSVSA